MPRWEMNNDIKWYMEQYPRRGAPDRSQLDDSVATFKSHITGLFTQLGLDVLPDSALTRPLSVRVLEGACGSSGPGGAVLWELLEKVEYWPDSRRPPQVTVSRVVNRSAAVGRRASPPPADRIHRILVVSARDLPDTPRSRLPSRTIVDIVANSPSTDVTVLRPASLRGLKEHLESHPDGYYTTVHLEVHGRRDDQDKDLARLEFLKPGDETVDATAYGVRHYFAPVYASLRESGNDTLLATLRPENEASPLETAMAGLVVSPPTTFIKDRFPAADVGALLVSHGVRQVVSVACYSAYNTTGIDNVATALVRSGLDAVVGMTFSAFERSSDLFQHGMYLAMLRGRTGFVEAARHGRTQMRAYPARRNPKSQKALEIDDFVIPVTYTSADYAQPDESGASGWSLDDEPSYDDPEDRRMFGQHGYELDVNKIECLLLRSRKPVMLVGASGDGKSTFISRLLRWWKASGLVLDTAHVRMGYKKPFDRTAVLTDLQAALAGVKDATTSRHLLAHLERYPRKCVVVLDQLDYLKAAGDREALLETVRLLDNAGAVVVTVGSQPWAWIQPHVVSVEMERLWS
jgi:hypothetical protein